MSTKFVFNQKGLIQILKSPQVVRLQEEAGRKVMESAKAMSGSDYYKMATHEGIYINFVNVYTGGMSAMVDNYKHNTLLKALSASGLKMKIHE